MSRVFVATETALDRTVVIKVLPPEMSGAMSAERFRRDIQFAARLHHPHIVPVLMAGEAGALLYYTMPFVDGDSLRSKLEREGELPIAEVVHLLHDVTDALSYAHTHGIVHRDLKPENILISGRHGLVTDFGVAKALSVAATRGAEGFTSAALKVGSDGQWATAAIYGGNMHSGESSLSNSTLLESELVHGRGMSVDAVTSRTMHRRICRA